MKKAFLIFLLLWILLFAAACSEKDPAGDGALKPEPSQAAAPAVSEVTETAVREAYDPFEDLRVVFSGFDTRGKVYLAYTGPAEGLLFHAGKEENISNGESIALRISTADGSDPRGMILPDGRVICRSETQVTAAGLTALTPFDPFSYVSVLLEGTEPKGELHAVYRGPLPLSLKQDVFTSLRNGDTVLLEIAPKPDYDPAAEGYRLVSSRTYLIQGLAHLPERAEEISAESLKEITEKVTADRLKAVRESWEDPESFADLTREDVLLEKTGEDHNRLTLVFRADVKGEESFSYYTYAQFTDLAVKEDGKILTLPEAYRTPSADLVFGHLHGDGFEKSGRFYTGFETKEALLKSLQEKKERAQATLLTVGDMLLHDAVFAQALQPDGSYNYDFVFKNMGGIFPGHDLVIANNEAIIGGNEYGQRGYPGFNTRTEFGDAEVKAGINVVLHANNHARDLNLSGIRHCLSYWKEKHPEMTVLGIHESREAAETITVLEVNGIRIALFNYTYGLNGLVIPEEESYLVDRMDESTRDKIGAELRKAEELADFTVVFPHWGTEYMLSPNFSQKNWAKWFVENGADLIIGNHPHCPQPAEWIRSQNGREGLCYYSLGNFISNQARTISTIGEIALVTIVKEGEDCYIADCDMDFEISWFTQACTEHEAIPLEAYTEKRARCKIASRKQRHQLPPKRVGWCLFLR